MTEVAVAAQPFELTALDVAYGNPLGEVEILPLPPRGGPSPVDEITRLVVDALRRPPCLVVLSDARESALLLELATTTARRLGLDDPVAAWVEAESEPAGRHREALVADLGLPERARVVVPAEDMSYLGTLARDALARHGLMFPAGAARSVPLLRLAAGGSVLLAQNAAQLMRFWRGRWLGELLRGKRPTRADLRALTVAHAPRSVRMRTLAPFAADWPPAWLQPGAAQELRERLLVAAVDSPIAWSTAVRRGWAHRCERSTAAALAALAAEHDVALTSTVDHPAVAGAIARGGGLRGFDHRVEVFAGARGWTVEPELVPPPAWTEAEREFAQAWSGAGLDPAVFDGERLRAAWLEGKQRSALALQQAWLASRG